MASELALKLGTIPEALRVAGLSAEPGIVAALIQASAMADLAEAVRSAAADIGAGLEEIAAARP